MKFKGLILDKFQEDAIASVQKGRSVMVSAPTGSGKTLIADYIIYNELQKGRKVIYTAPIKALSNQKYKEFTKDHGEDKIGLITGDIVINPEAQILIMTTEVYRNMAVIKDPLLKDVSYCIMDEIHYLSDAERGVVWEESIIFSPANVEFLFLSATVPNADEFASWVEKIKEKPVDVIRHSERPVPLAIRFYDVDLGVTTLDKIKERKKLDNYPEYGHIYKKRSRFKSKVKPPSYIDVIRDIRDKLPCIYFVFSRKKTQEYAVKLAKDEFLKKDEKSRVAELVQKHFRKVPPDVVALRSSQDLRHCLSKGVAFHHAGMLPDLKHIIETLFTEGLVKVLFATETFAVGINMPVKTVLFDSLRKYTGTGFRFLNTKEFYQISGRAGRRGMDKEGLSISVIHRPTLDFKMATNLTKGDRMPIKSQFQLSYNTVLNMVNLHTDEEIDKILRMSFYTYQDKKARFTIKARYAKAYKVLNKMNYIKDRKLTDLGIFTTKIYANELQISQIMMNFIDLDEYQQLLIIGAVAFEEKKELTFNETYESNKTSKLVYNLRNHEFLKRSKWIKNLEKLTGVVYPLFQQKKFIEILQNSDMQEGDLMRLLLQMMDRLEQIDRALLDDKKRHVVRNCKYLIRDCLEGIGFF